MSQSNDPSVQLNRNLDTLLGASRPEVEARTGNLLPQVLVPRNDPEPAPAITAATLSSAAPAAGGKQWECLTEALYFEARGETIAGITAVAEVILNRVDSKRFPKTVCGVVNQGTGRKYQCQFSYACDGRAEVVHEKKAWRKVGKIAAMMLDGAPRKLTRGATFYHTKQVSPSWSRSFDKTATIGAHIFYSLG
ncbi:cell wall hydrolase [Profundibacterium mesophilum]|nr:cell wall hydrolase [Profundibacterium mesophilum]